MAEVANAAWRRTMKGQIPQAQAVLINQQVPRIFWVLFPLTPLRERALAIAGALAHPVYDCFYLALAESEGAAMVTADRRLIARIGGTRWAGACRSLVG